MGNAASDEHYYLTADGKATENARTLIKEKLKEEYGEGYEDAVSLEEHVKLVERSMALVNKHFPGSRTSADTLDRVRTVVV